MRSGPSRSRFPRNWLIWGWLPLLALAVLLAAATVVPALILNPTKQPIDATLAPRDLLSMPHRILPAAAKAMPGEAQESQESPPLAKAVAIQDASVSQMAGARVGGYVPHSAVESPSDTIAIPEALRVTSNSLLKKSGATAGLPSSASISPEYTAGQASSGTRFSNTGLFQQAAIPPINTRPEMLDLQPSPIFHLPVPSPNEAHDGFAQPFSPSLGLSGSSSVVPGVYLDDRHFVPGEQRSQVGGVDLASHSEARTLGGAVVIPVDSGQTTDRPEGIRPEILDLRPAPVFSPPEPTFDDDQFVFTQPFDPPLGFTGPSSILPYEYQVDSHFVPMEDRWRAGFPQWDRYDRDHPLGEDYLNKTGHWWDPYNQNVLKGDYPIAGQNTFLNVTLKNVSFLEFRQIPLPTTPFESTIDPFQQEFFGNPDQFFYQQLWVGSIELFHGDAGFKEPDWRLKVTPIFNINYLDVEELGIVNPNVLMGTTRFRDDFALEEWYVEKKLADLSPDFDFLAVRAGSQPFISDFRGLIFADINRGVRLFGTRLSNREQFNLVWFDQTEKNTNSQLNTFDDRHQNTVIANYFRQDTIWPGYTMQLSFHYNRDGPSFKFDDNDFLARPDPAGVFAQHRVETYYLGWAGDGHINRFNISHAFYYAFGEDSLNPLAGRKVAIDAYMAACEVSYDRDWARFRASGFYASGDDDISDGVAQGFDAIFENQNFAGGIFSYWNRQQIRLFGLGLTQQNSLLVDLTSSKGQGQANFVNPGLLLFNVGVDFDLTPKLKWINNVNFLWFDDTDVLEHFTFQAEIDRHIGTDLSTGIEYRPLLNNNIIIESGVSGLLPGEGFEDLYNPFNGDVDGLVAVFLALFLEY